jgi:hypothetical protein
MSLAVLALLRSDGFRRVGWSLVFGVAIGLLPLTRTVTIAFLPALGVAALLLALLSKEPRSSLLRLILVGFIALTVMATWLVPDGRYVANYLLEFGYGSRSVVYNPGIGPTLADQFVYMLQYLAAYTYLPSFLFMLLGLALDIAVLAVSLATVRGRVEDATWHQRLAILIIALGGLGALMTSQNKGAAFATPLIPLLLVLATCGFMHSRRYRLGSAIAYLAAAAAAVWPAATMVDLAARVAWPHMMTVPVLGTMTVSNGIGPIQGYETSAGYTSATPTMPVSAGDGKRWLEALWLTALTAADSGGDHALTAFGARGYLFNTNEVNFVWMFGGHRFLPMVQATPEILGDNADAYQAFLTSGEGATACLLITATGTLGEIRPSITPAYMVEAAQRTGFEPGPRWPLPDGREATLWSRQHAAAPCPVR